VSQEGEAMKYSLHPLGEMAVMIELGNELNLEIQQKVLAISSYLEDNPLEWMVEYIPAFSTVTIFYNPMMIINHLNIDTPIQYVCQQLHQILSHITINQHTEPRVVEIPVCYGEEFGPDLETVASMNGLTTEDVISIHSSAEYTVYMIGFAPGFPYLGGMSEKIAAPRLPSPRLKIPERTVGIAGKQTGVYPIATPGGWQLIGRTPIKLFRPNDKVPSLLNAGDKVRFKPISYEEYVEWEGKEG